MISDAQKEHARKAWIDAVAMNVLVDRLLEDGHIVAVDAASMDASHPRSLRNGFSSEHTLKDDALYLLECAAREWILKAHDAQLELRVTGGWPEILFVVYRNYGLDGWDATLSERIEFVPGVKRQPRLLRSSR